MITFLMLALAHSQGAQPPVLLKHTFTKGIKSEYSVDANLQIEARGGELATFLPEEVEYRYTFFTNTLDVSNSIATMRYSRPSMTQITGASTESDPVPKTEQLNILATMELSPVNQVLDLKDQTPKRAKPESDSPPVLTIRRLHEPLQDSVLEFIGPFIIDLEQLSVFIGSIDGSLDLEPKLNLDAVKIGDTWKRTVGYQPQKLGSKAGKTVVQRLDLVYTYNGTMQSRGKTVQRVHGELKLDTDLGKYVNELFGATPENTGLRSIPTKMDIEMDFDLDPATLQTIYATVKSDGSFKIFALRRNEPVLEQNIHGKSVMKLVSNKNVLGTQAKK